MTSRNVAVVTGTRAEYGLLKSSMRAIVNSEELSLSVIATGMHLSPQYGCTVEEILEDGFDVDRRVQMLLDGDSGLSMAKSLGIGISGLSETLSDVDPDIVLVLGDRDEALAGGIAAAHMNIPVAHIHGGDSMEGAIIDDSIRHALTKFSHLHFPVSERSKKRLLQLGEEEWRVEVVGAPGLDAIKAGEYEPGPEVISKFGLEGETPLGLLVQHPVTTQSNQAGQQMRATLEAITNLDTWVAVIYPNSDAGGKQMIEVIHEFENRSQLSTFENLPRREFLGLMDAADVMIGNSSSAIIEAPSFGLPAVDIGPRQEGRERADNTVSVPHDAAEIEGAIRTCLVDESVRRLAQGCSNPYDYGGAGERIANRLARVDLDDRLLRKRLTY